MAEVWYLPELRKRGRKIKDQDRKIRELEEKLKEKDSENKDLKDELKKLAERKTSKRPKFPDYSLSKQERLLRKEKGKSTGRRTKAEKMKEVTREEDIYPEGISPESCVPAGSRIITHLTNGKKEVILYHIYRKKRGKKRGKVPGVFPRSEYSVEVVIALAFLIYELHLTTEQARKILEFFCDLKIGKSEIDSLLQNLSVKWEKEFNAISDLILLALVVYIDETGWKISAKRCFAWIFKSLNHTLLLYGESREEEVLDRILPLGKFMGTAVTDCYSIYIKRFKKAQKCWAHFLRDAIKLMLLFPENKKYKIFFEEALKIFRDGKEAKKNTELTEVQKQETVTGLEERITALCTEVDVKLNKDTDKDYRKFVNLQKRMIKNFDDLFVFVTGPAEPTSNHAERGLRPTSRARNNYQTSKTKKGAKRRSIITSVLTSLKQNLPAFTLKDITDEVLEWEVTGKSMFQIQLQALQGRASP